MIRRLLRALRRREPELSIDDTQEFDPIRQEFVDYQQSVADILDANPQRRDELIRQLNAATAEWEKAEFKAVVHSLKRDFRFRLAVRRVMRDRHLT